MQNKAWDDDSSHGVEKEIEDGFQGHKAQIGEFVLDLLHPERRGHERHRNAPTQ
jgi:hypothetical protein